MTDLAKFLLACIAEDEAAAREAEAAEDRGDGDAGWIAPSFVLVECDAKRRIVESATQGGDCQGHPGSYQPHGEYGPGYCRDFSDNQYLRLLALPYADHPDYREEWRP